MNSMNELSELIKKATFMFVTNGIGKGAALVANIMMARMLGVEIYGEFTYVFSIILILSIFPKLGFDNSLLVFIPKNELEQKSHLSGELATLSIIITTVFACIMILVLKSNLLYFSEKLFGSICYSEQLAYQLPLIIGLSLIFVVPAVFQARKQMALYTLFFNVGRFGLFVILIPIFFIYNVNHLFIPVLSMDIALGLSITTAIWIAFKKGYLKRVRKKHISNYIRFVQFSFPFLLIGSVGLILDRLNVYMVGYYLDDRSVAIFNSASQIALITSFMLLAVNQVFAPMISTFHHISDYKKLNKIYGQINIGLTILSFGIMTLVYVFRDSIMGLFGAEFIEGTTALVILSGGQVFNAVSGPCGYILNMTGHHRVNLYINILMIGVVFFLNVILIPTLGYIGAAIAASMSLIIVNFMRMVFMYKFTGIIPFKIS